MTRFEQRVLDRCEEVFVIQDRPVESFDMEDKYLKILFLKNVYGFSNQEIVDYIGEGIRQQLELQKDLHRTTLWRKQQELQENDVDGQAVIRKAAKRAVFQCCAAGEPVPKRVLEEHEIPVNIVLSNDLITRANEQDALRNWIKWFFAEILQPLTYNREETTYPYRSYVGLCAHSALQTIAPNDAVNTADYLYDEEHIPSGASLTKNIRRLIDTSASDENQEFPEALQDQFEACYRRFFAEANRLGFFENKKRVVADVTPIPTTGDEDSSGMLTGGSGSGRTPAKYGKHSWRYQFLSIPDSDAPFIRSIAPVYNASRKHEPLGEQLATITSDSSLDVDLLICDKGYYRTNVVDVCREYLDDSWVICAKAAGEIGQLMRNTPKGQLAWQRHVTFGDPPMRKKPGAFVYPNTKEETNQQRNLSDFSDTTEELEQPKSYVNTDSNRSHIAYITDLQLNPERIRKIHVLYNQRAAIESTIGQVRHTFLPHTESMDATVRTYMINIAGLFYNLHHLIKRTLSPEHGVPLNPSGKELLTAIRDVAFT